MNTNELQQKAITVQGKHYILVSDRIIYFNDNYRNGLIKTELLSDPENDKIVFKATIIPDTANPSRFFIGHSQAIVGVGAVNKTAAMENAETSAVGRALGMMGIGVIDSIASHDEIVKAEVVPHIRQETENDYAYEKTDQAFEELQPHFCTMHQMALKERMTNAGGKYYDHRIKDGEVWKRCNGTGWK